MIEPQPIASTKDDEQGWGEYKHPCNCAVGCTARCFLCYWAEEAEGDDEGAEGGGAQARVESE